MQDKNGLRTKLGLIGCIIMVVFGWFMYFKFYSEIKNPLSFMLALGLFTVFVVLVAIKIFTSSKSIAEQQTEIDKKMEGSVVGRAVSAGVNSWNIDIEVFKVIFKKPLLVVPFAISTILIALVIYVPLQSGSIGRLLGVMYNAGINNAIIFPIIILVYSFVSIFIYVLGYITLGYLLRRKYLDIRENYITSTISRFFRLFSFWVLLSITWFISIFTIGGKKRRGASAVGDMASSVASTATGGIVSAFKMFIYMNIVRVSMGDEKSSFKDTYEFMKTDIYKLLRVWIGSGLLISTVLFLGIIVLFALTKMGVIPVNDTSKAIIAPIFFGCVVFVFIFRAFSEQIGIFSVYIKDKYQKDII